MKLRLTFLVVLSSMAGFLFAAHGNYSFVTLLYFALGGFLITVSSNAINQLYEKDSDKLMRRTENRPLPLGHLQPFEVALFVGVTGLLGALIFLFYFNAMTALMSLVSLILYGFIYTPLKKVGPIAVFVGAIPGALPPLLGYTAYTNQIDSTGLWIFAIQFFWQFPHFWAIAWRNYDDYLRAGIMLLPNHTAKSRSNAMIIFLYTAILIPLSITPLFIISISVSNFCIILNTINSIIFTYFAYKLLKEVYDDKLSLKLMFYSFIYLIVFLISIFL